VFPGEFPPALRIAMFSAGSPCADALYPATGHETQCSQTLQASATRLRGQTYTAAVVDQFLLATEADESDRMIENLGTAFPVDVNFAVTGVDRLVREVRSALHRHKREEGSARRAVAQPMHPRCVRL
jgi:histidinol-phosphate/aromatic aminotransferase/cobyric acid decarboxylase-like protein